MPLYAHDALQDPVMHWNAFAMPRYTLACRDMHHYALQRCVGFASDAPSRPVTLYNP